MKKLLVALIIGLLSFTFFVGDAWAHPGRTDKNGGHTCRTNCAKWGYKTGEYHFHNKNKSTTSSSSATTSRKTSAPATTPAPKPAYTQEDVDSGRESGRKLGYEDGYARGSQTPKSATGNEGYKIGYAAGYEAGYNDGLRKIRDEDKLAGTTSGEADGKTSYRDGKDKEVAYISDQSDDWNTAYKAAFIKTYDYEKIIHSSEQSGHELGYSLAELVVPANLAKDETLKKAFESHYKIGNEERVKEEKSNHLALGKKDGYALTALAIDSLDDRFVDSYKQGYEEGKLKLKAEILDEGHQSAFINMKYEVPGTYEQQELKDWHKEGYEANDIAVEIKEKAFEEGRTNAEYVIPEEFKVNAEATALYNSLFEEGQEKRAEEKRKNMIYTAGIGIPSAGAAVGGYFLMKRKRKKTI
ncbi:YHYH domain-containing protein [Sporosarcina sp. G11-34]|uniref:YHYH domain-containing protein n=1 Tax=Sporosarcina sp. G11-34 TaxID=2849605 RepID=UPI0022A93DEE|nr:YHYH domain-containing protein [Sporosarcina sp. G11-34]MCZ2258585.1 YHYH domain-containing protein [Sporosarcina sp. G11-34]